jgi:hypothetical protein
MYAMVSRDSDTGHELYQYCYFVLIVPTLTSFRTSRKYRYSKNEGIHIPR